ncbi:ABC-type polysaccharide/polyol phosphate transport system, ATPase component [Pseudomonas sp. GM18]|uniref:ABC transporter ATP-binding protein n=1 Tax=Pseudomonas sp. GM18 TaxID=1144324 RepID=UPI0002725B26|nr:ABC transporter ATP-binding protein [Pseudomonas sp. GM18]EJM14025.1 ABC-type polysaccharide/polyol phosphate transport system, ATPase component [Pseudomonas sp. GM18]
MGSISVRNLGKAYKVYSNRWSRLAEWLIPFSGTRHTLKWVLNDLSFEIKPGEAMGIIGMNGAGKSTLLKMITGTTQPTHGTVAIKGRVAALLELGMGFHPDFTGRQNAIMAGQLLGYSVQEIDELMPQIIEFAEIGSSIDQPVRMYSSGMQMRLAFSVATANRPDVLIVDEALSVGDAYFQHKSFERIRKLREEGTTLLIVSHDKAAIQSICDRAILLNEGNIAIEGSPEAVMDYYNAMLAERDSESVHQAVTPQGKLQALSGSGEAIVEEIILVGEDGTQVETVNVGQQVALRITVRAVEDLPQLVLGYMIKDRLGQEVFGTNTFHLDRKLEHITAGSKLVFNFAFSANLGEGTYSVATGLHDADTHLSKNYEWRDLALIFNIVNLDKDGFVGVSWMPPSLELHR